MKATKLAIALIALAVAGSADAILLCRNDLGQQIEWHSTNPRINLAVAGFDTRGAVACFLSRQALFYAAQMGLPVPLGYDANRDSGLIYRGDQARYLLDNIAAMEGKPATRGEFDTLPL